MLYRVFIKEDTNVCVGYATIMEDELSEDVQLNTSLGNASDYEMEDCYFIITDKEPPTRGIFEGNKFGTYIDYVQPERTATE